MVLAKSLWLLASLPIVTWPAATAGLFTLVRRAVAEELDDASWTPRLGDFWDGFRAHWHRGTLVAPRPRRAGGDRGRVRLLRPHPAEPLRWLVGPIALVLVTRLAANLFVYPLVLHRRARHRGRSSARRS